MFSLLYGLWEYMSRKEEYRILILGIDKAGKTTLLEKIKSLYTDLPGLEPESILPTVGLNVGRLEAHNAQLIFWDLGGQPGLRSIWDKYYADSHAILFVIDAAAPARFDEAKDALESILGHRELFGAPLLVFANKQDSPQGLLRWQKEVKDTAILRRLRSTSQRLRLNCQFATLAPPAGLALQLSSVAT
ncbi:hypothetical protein WJX72_006284 [[Myrmecia] bisecta]|uniref:ADP-ribosylation factor-related protein 1 n=1 Tax=[Myrmecia] bisecta TaxID=41462 RepID=A0AAW1P663_9CHLO